MDFEFTSSNMAKLSKKERIAKFQQLASQAEKLGEYAIANQRPAAIIPPMGQCQPIAKVLVVEDDAVSHCIVAGSLRRRGFDVVPAKDAAEAIAILRKNHDIAAVFSDIVMPGEMDGWELQYWIQVNRPGLPVILGSAYPEKAQPSSGEEFRFFAKPYNIDAAIAACIRSLT